MGRDLAIIGGQSSNCNVEGATPERRKYAVMCVKKLGRPMGDVKPNWPSPRRIWDSGFIVIGFCYKVNIKEVRKKPVKQSPPFAR